MKKFDLGLYLVTDSSGLTEDELMEKCEAALKGGVTLIQLREKTLPSGEFLRRAVRLKELAHRYGVPLIINDRIDIALASHADGVHLGQADIPVAAARKILGSDFIIGCTAKTVELGKQARADGADYIGSGAIYGSDTKSEAMVTPLWTIDEICRESRLPVVAIGGLDNTNLEILRGSQVAGIALSGAIMKAEDPAAEAAKILKQVKDILK